MTERLRSCDCKELRADIDAASGELMNVRPITRNEHLDYLESSVRLKLWFVRQHLQKHPDEPFRFALDHRVDIWRKTSLNPEHLDGAWSVERCPRWPALASALEAIHLKTRDEPTSAGFEDQSLALLRPYLHARADRDLEDIRNKVDLRSYQCGSLRYDTAVRPEHPQRIIFHIANDCYPESPFADPAYFPRCFLDLMAACEQRFGVREIGTGTWLNSEPRWLRLFPEEWRANMSAPITDVYWHYGFWGQFLTARKTFNHKLAAQFRQTGEWPYALRSSWCTITALRKDLHQWQ